MDKEEDEWPARSALKKVSIRQIEDALGNTLTELLGKEYGVRVIDIDWSTAQTFQDGAKLTINGSEPSPLRDMVNDALKKAQ